MHGFGELEAPELQALLEARVEDVALIDVRNPAEVARGQIPGARNIPLHLLPLSMDELTAEGRPLVLYCHSGARSAQACRYLAGCGHERVYNLRGGILGWLQSGRPVTTPLN
jgi:rhodanese-related sulfurtransferase